MHLSDAPAFLSDHQIAAEVARFTYRLGWTLGTFVDPWEGICLYVTADLANGYNPGVTTPVRIRSVIPPIPDTLYLGHWLLKRLILIEIHEAREFLRRDGQLFSDPHDPIEPDPARMDDEDPEEYGRHAYRGGTPVCGGAGSISGAGTFTTGRP